MSRLSFGSSYLRTLLATAAVSLSFAASSASSETSALIKDREIRCGENTDPVADTVQDLQAMLCAAQAEEDDRAYLLATASPGATMTRQGPETAIARLNPEFVARLAGAIREARESGLPSAGIFSAYRPPVFGVGGFSDKFKSLHSYGLAVDMSGIGEPGSKETRLWHEIAARHDIFCPYGVDNRTEWNHCQATPIKIVFPDNPLRKTISAQGPIELDDMFRVGTSIIDNAPAATSVVMAANRPDDSDSSRPHAARAVRVASSERHDRRHSHVARNLAASARARRGEKTKTVILVAELRHGERSHSRTLAEEKPHETRKAARASEGHRNATRHRSHLA